MLNDLKTTLARCAPTMIEDAFGVVALFALLIAGLHLPFLA
jgi:hypothetical protein